MKKLIPYFRLALFSGLVFALLFAGLLLKQGRLFKKEEVDAALHGTKGEGGEGGEKGEGGEEGAPKDGSEPHLTKASMDGGAGKSGGKPPPDEAGRKTAVGAGRALFEVPEPISIAEATELLNEVKRAKKDYEEKKAFLDQRERDIETMQKELEATRAKLVEMAEQVGARAPAAAAPVAASDVPDAKTILDVAKVFSLMQPQKAAKALSFYPPDRAAMVLMAMKDPEAKALLAQMEEADLAKLTEALLRAKRPADEE